MKVLCVATAYSRFKGDIITPWLVEFVKRLKNRGINISIFTSSYRGLDNQILDGIKIYRFRYFLKRYERLTHEETAVDRISRGPFNIILTVFYLLFGALSIVRLTRNEKFDIIHINWPFPHIIFGVLGKKFGRARLFSSFYGVEIRWLKKKFPFLIKPFSIFINKSDVVTAISTHTAKELEGIVTSEVEIIPFSAAIGEKSAETTDEKEIIFVGRLVERKGVEYLIRAMEIVKNEVPHRLIIIGDGPERQHLEEVTRSLGLEEKVTFTGMISNGERNDHYKRCSFFVLPAVYDKKGDTEGLGVVLLEAMSYSKPVIASKVGGITDIVVNRVNGLLVPPADPPALAEAIKLLATNELLKKKMGEQAKKNVDARFNWNRIIGNLIILYEKYH